MAIVFCCVGLIEAYSLQKKGLAYDAEMARGYSSLANTADRMYHDLLLSDLQLTAFCFAITSSFSSQWCSGQSFGRLDSGNPRR